MRKWTLILETDHKTSTHDCEEEHPSPSSAAPPHQPNAMKLEVKIELLKFFFTFLNSLFLVRKLHANLPEIPGGRRGGFCLKKSLFCFFFFCVEFCSKVSTCSPLFIKAPVLLLVLGFCSFPFCFVSFYISFVTFVFIFKGKHSCS